MVTLFAAGTDYVVSSGQDVTEQRRLQAALEDTDRRKDEFLAMLAHELRNPVAPIANAAELLSRLVQHESQRALVGIVQRQSVHLGRLLDDLLDVARITQGRIELQREVIDVGTCLQLAIETAEPLIRSKTTSPDGHADAGADLRSGGQGAARPVHGERARQRGEVHTRRRRDLRSLVSSIAAKWWSKSPTTVSASRPNSCRASSTCSRRPSAASTDRKAGSASA